MAGGSCIIVGASHAGAQLALSLAQGGYEGAITVIGAEPHLPYHRPPLSKGILAGSEEPDTLVLRPEAAYAKAGVAFRLGTRVASLDRAAREVVLDGGERLPYDALALCTGSRVRTLDVPGAGLAGIHVLRSLDDGLALRAAARAGGRAVIVGGGYIGLEVAASLRGLGLEVTVLEALDRLLGRVAPPAVAAFAARVHREEGVDVRTGAAVVAFEGEGRVTGVRLADGASLPADIVVVGIGVIPETGLAAAAGLEVGNGIVVDEHCRTSDPAIVAAGDCTEHPNPHVGRRVRLESVPNANDQAKVAAATILGTPRGYPTAPWFWSSSTTCASRSRASPPATRRSCCAAIPRSAARSSPSPSPTAASSRRRASTARRSSRGRGSCSGGRSPLRCSPTRAPTCASSPDPGPRRAQCVAFHCPPSARTRVPVTSDARGEARNATTAATSSGRPWRPSAERAAVAA